MASQFLRALGVRCIDASIEQAAPRAWEGYQYGHIWSGLEDFCDLVVSSFGREIILLSDIDNIAGFGVWICSSHV